MVSVRKATVDLFRSHGLTTWFGNPGSSELTLLEEFPDDFRYLLGLQEMVPVGMADSYAQITRRPAVVNVHTAPGLNNAQGALYNAFVNKTPLIVTAGNQRRVMQNQYCLLTNIDATTVPKPFVKWAAEPAIASETSAVLAHAIHLATTPPMGPVFVSLPMDDMQAELDDTQVADSAALRERKVTQAVGFPADLAEQICARIDAATSPALIVGGDVERYGAWDAVIGLAERTQCPVWTAPITGWSGFPWSGFPENHPLYQGSLPPGAGWISQRLAGHDLLLVLGAPVFRCYPHIPGPYLPEGASLIHITNDPDEAARAPVGDAIIAAQLAAPDRPVVALMGDGSMHYAITALWTAAHYRIPVTVVGASNAEYGILKQFGKLEKTPGVPGLDLPGLNVVATAASYGVDAHEAHSTDEVLELVESGIADRDRPTLINAPIIRVDA